MITHGKKQLKNTYNIAHLRFLITTIICKIKDSSSEINFISDYIFLEVNLPSSIKMRLTHNFSYHILLANHNHKIYFCKSESR